MQANAYGASASSSDLQVTLYLADHLVRAGQWALAIDHYRWAGAAFASRGEVHNALAVYSLLQRLLPHCLHTQGMVAELYRQLGRRDHAAAIYERIAAAHKAHGRWVEATHVCRLVVEIDPTTVARRLRLAELYVFLGHRGPAAQHLEVAAGQLLAGNRHDAFLRVAKRLLALRPDHAPTLRDQVRVYLGNRDLRRATRQLRRLLALYPRDDVGRELLAACLVLHGRPDRACRALRLLAVEVAGRGAHTYDEARRLLVHAVTIHPHDAAARRSLQAHEVSRARPSAGAPSSTAAPDADTNVRVLHAPGVPLPTTDPWSSPYGQVIYAQFAC